MKKISAFIVLIALSLSAMAQRYQGGLIDKSIAVVGNELITLSSLEQEMQMLKTQGVSSDKLSRCELLENMMESKLFLMQARLDSLTVGSDMVEAELSQRLDQAMTVLGGEDGVESYFGKSVYKLRQDWRTQLEENSLIQQEQGKIAQEIKDVTPYDVAMYVDTSDVEMLPIIPVKYKLSQICMYPDKEAAAIAVKERLLALRERIIAGEKFSTLARLYSEDPGTARKGGELGMASKSIFWPAFSDAAMSLKEGTISQIVETPDGFHIIEVIEKKGDMFNARHILLKPKYTQADQELAFSRLDSLKTAIRDSVISFEMAAKIYSMDAASRTNGGQMADPHTGSTYFEIDLLKPQDYAVVKDLKEGEISDPIQSKDNEGNDGNLVYKIIRLDKIIPVHTATMENDYTELYNDVKAHLQTIAIREFVEKKISETYIRIDPLFKDCKFSSVQWASKFREE